MRNYSLRGRMLALVLTSVAAGWLVLVAASYLDIHRRLDRLLDAHLAQSAELLIAQAHEQLEEIELEQPKIPLRYAQPIAFQIWEGGSRLALRSATAPERMFSPVQTGLSDSTVGGVPWRVYDAWDAERRFLVQVAEDHRERERIAASMALTSLLPLLVGLPVLGLLIALTINRACRPLAALAEEVRSRDARSLEPVGAANVPREVRPLVERLNGLFERVRRSLESERHFTADAAHEMRNPLAAVRAQAEVARAVAADLAPAAHAQGVDIELDAPAPALVTGEPALLESLLRNLVDNAIRHGGGGIVRIVVAQDGESVRLNVADAGEALSDAELAHLGQRFFRGAAARGVGSGLGLSIVRQIAELHGAQLEFVRGASGRGLVAGVTFRATSR